MSRNEPIEVLITDGNRRPSVEVVRSLGRQGVSLIVVGEEPGSLAFSSRYARHTAVSPPPGSEPDAYFEFILDLVKRHGIELVIPVLDTSLLALDHRRAELEQHACLAAADSQALRSVLDKRINLRLANRLGVPCPAQYELDSTAQIPDMIERLGLPLVLKPPGSPFDPQLPSFPFKVLYANDESQLRDYLDRYCSDGVYPIFQQFAPGMPRNLCCLVSHGEIVAMYEHASRRSLKGQGVLRDIVATTPAIQHAAADLARGLNWNGLAQFCFFLDRNSGRLNYMETNGRIWSSIAGAAHAGWDLPYWAYRYFRFGDLPQPPPIRVGTRSCWRRGDLVALGNYLAGGEAPGNGPEPGRFSATLQYLASFSPAVHSDLYSWDDPMPEFRDHWQLLKRGASALRSRGLRDPRRLSRPQRN